MNSVFPQVAPYPSGSMPMGDSTTDRLMPLATKSANGETLTTEEQREVAEGFESMMIKMMLKETTSSMLSENMFGSGPGAEHYLDMYNDNMAQVMTSAGGIGLADEMLSMMEARQASEDTEVKHRFVELNNEDTSVWGAPRPADTYRALERKGGGYQALPERGPQWRSLVTEA